jgi:hypothetical protein
MEANDMSGLTRILYKKRAYGKMLKTPLFAKLKFGMVILISK